MPYPVFEWARRLGTALLAPVSFSVSTGHLRSSLLRRAVDKLGRPVPWYTYPAIDFLGGKDLSTRHVLEWGAGQSTLWWSMRTESVLTFEHDRTWYEYIRPRLPSTAAIHLVSLDVRESHEILLGQRFDLVVIDGLDRFRCAVASLPVLQADGAVLLDNSEGYWGVEGQYPILDLFRRHGFQRVDFFGYAPGVLKAHCTSLFFKSDCFLLRGEENVRRVP